MAERNFPGGWVDAYCRYNLVSEAPAISHFWTGVWTVAGALRRSVWYSAGGFDWVPNFYIVLVGPPGVIQKSTTAGKGEKLLAKVPEIVFGPASATWHGLLPKFNAAEQKLVAEDGGTYTVSPLTMSVSELGSFLKLSQEGLDAVLIDMWDGQLKTQPWTHTTQTHGDKTVWNGVLNLLGCTTLGWVREAIPASALETGLVSRILFVYADAKRETISIPKLDPRWNPRAQRENAARLADDLCAIAELRGPMELSPEAYVWQRAWYDGVWARRPSHMASERWDVYRSRKQSHAMKLSIVLTAAKGADMVISEATFREAVAAVEAAERGMVRIFETIGGPAEAQHLREVIGLVTTLTETLGLPPTVPELFRRLQNMLSYDELASAVRVAVGSGQLETKPTTRGGRAVLGLSVVAQEEPKA